MIFADQAHSLALVVYVLYLVRYRIRCSFKFFATKQFLPSGLCPQFPTVSFSTMLQQSNVILLTIQKLQKLNNWLFFDWIQLGVHSAHFWTPVDCDRVWQLAKLWNRSIPISFFVVEIFCMISKIPIYTPVSQKKGILISFSLWIPAGWVPICFWTMRSKKEWSGVN